MIVVGYFELFLLAILLLIFFVVTFRTTRIIYTRDKNYYEDLHKKAMDEITEDVRQKIFLEKYAELREEIKEEIEGDLSVHKVKTEDKSKLADNEDFHVKNNIGDQLKDLDLE